MAARVVFRNNLSSRFVSAEEAGGLESVTRYVFGGPSQDRQILSFGQLVENLAHDAQPNWLQDDSKWGAKWVSDEGMLNLSALVDAEVPEGAIAFQVRYSIANNPDYKQGYMSSDFLGIEQWPPDLSAAGDRGALGVDSVFFRVRQ